MHIGTASARKRVLSSTLAAIGVLAALAVPTALARPAGADTDGRPNILVVMTDDMATTDLQFMPNVRRLLVKQGTKFADAVDSFPLCCPARATFITGQYAHNNGVGGQLLPLRLVRDEGPRQHPPGLAPEGRLPDRADRQVAERLRGARRPRRGPARLRHLARPARRLRLRLLQLRHEPQRRVEGVGRRELRPQAGRVRKHRGDPEPGRPGRGAGRSGTRSSDRRPIPTGEPTSGATTHPTSPAG